MEKKQQIIADFEAAKRRINAWYQDKYGLTEDEVKEQINDVDPIAVILLYLDREKTS